MKLRRRSRPGQVCHPLHAAVPVLRELLPRDGVAGRLQLRPLWFDDDDVTLQTALRLMAIQEVERVLDRVERGRPGPGRGARAAR